MRKPRKEEPCTITHVRADGTVQYSMEGVVVTPNERTKVAYAVLAKYEAEHPEILDEQENAE